MKKIMTLIAAAAVMTACCCNNNNKKAENNCENACLETKTECCEAEKAECPALEGKWTVSMVNGTEVKLEKMPFIEFNAAEKKFHGNAGVNIMNGNYEQNCSKLTFGEAATTMMAGQEAETTVERAILKNIAEVTSFNATCCGKIELLNAEGTVLMVLTK